MRAINSEPATQTDLNMRQSAGWYFLLVAGWMLIMGLPMFAQGNQPRAPLSKRDPIFEKLRPDEIIKQARERFKNAQNKEQVENVKMWCKDTIAQLISHKPGDCCWRRRRFSTHIKLPKQNLASRGCKH